MSTTPQLRMAALRGIVCFTAMFLLSGCYSPYHSVYGQVGLTSHPASLEALKKWDLAGAAHILETRLAAKPKDAELSYTLGCVYLMQSDKVGERSSKCSLQTHGWQLVEAASGRYYMADGLLAHGYLVGRWGKKRNSALYSKHLKLSMEIYRAQPVSPKDEGARTWVIIVPP